MKTLRLAALLLVSAISIMTGAHAAALTPTQPAAPDFAYPQTVTKQAESALDKALKASDGKAVVRALADMALAQSAIGNEKLPPVVKRIEQIRTAETDPVTHALLSLLLADIYNDIYQSDAYTYSERPALVGGATDTDYTAWSANTFIGRIKSLCDDALTHADALHAAPLADYSDIITADRQTLIFYPTLYDFAASFNINLLQNLGSTDQILPLLYLSPRADFEHQKFGALQSDNTAKILSIYAQWLKYNEANTAPIINIDIRRINMVTQNLFPSLRAQGESRRHQLLLDLYHQYAQSEYSGLVLQHLYILPQYMLSAENMAAVRELCKMLEHNISAFPAYTQIGCLQNALAQIKHSSFNVSTPTAVYPGSDFKVKISATNTPGVVIDFLRVELPDRRRPYYERGTSKETLVKSVTVDLPGSVPFYSDTTITTSLPSEGYFIAVARTADGKKLPRTSFDVIRSSRLSMGALNLASTGFIYGIDPLTGAPAPKATLLSLNPSKRNSKFAPVGETDKSGFYDYALTDASIFAIERGTDTYAATLSIYPTNIRETADTLLTALTDLSIYHPGDTIKWVAVAYSVDGNNKQAVGNLPISISLCMANGEYAGESTAFTDGYGRATGSFAIPKEGLTGYAWVEVTSAKSRATARVMVSDYKLPTYFVDIDAPLMNAPTQGAVTITGTATTYSGVNIDGGTATLSLAVAQPMWWARTNAITFHNATTQLSGQGKFTFELPADIFTTSPTPNGIYQATITVTSPNGETRQAKREFTLGPTYLLNLTLGENIDITSPVRLNLRVTDCSDTIVDKTVAWTLTNKADGRVYSGTLQSADPVCDWTAIPSGKYAARFIVEGTDSAYASIVDPVVLYRPTDKHSPVDALLWTPVTTLTADTGGKASLLYATAKPDQHLLYTLVDDNRRIIERRWLDIKEGMHRLEIRLPNGTRRATAYLASTLNFTQSLLSVEVLSQESTKRLDIRVESFRDKVTPLASETWSFTTTDNLGTPMATAMMLNMYNAALKGIDGININPWQLGLRNQYYPRASLTMPAINGNTYLGFSDSDGASYDCRQLSAPQWLLYGRSFSSQIFMKQFGVQLMSARGVRRDNSYPTMAVAKEAAVAEDAADMSTADTGSTSDGDQSAAPADDSFAYRTGEIASAFFAPTLTTDAQGHLTYSFIVPNANTTWAFEALAYTPQMLTTSINREVVSSKPVMVQPNLPRFMRCGDKGTIAATVYNNTDTATTITTTVETFNPATGAILSSATDTITVAANSLAVVSTDIQAPADAPLLGYRIKSSNGAFTDGEQQLITILPFTTPVIETEPFYLAPDSLDLSLTLPTIPDDARVTLQYTNNPVWYVVTALPGLQQSSPTTITAAADAIYSAAIADGLLRGNPEIARALDVWSKSDKSSTALTSMLEQNADLKTVLLSATPWMMEAASDTERMTRLALLFDKSQIESVYNAAIDCMAKLQNPDGGLGWGAFSPESTTWATSVALKRLGMLNKLGYLPTDKRLTALIGPALQYLQTQATKQWAKRKSDNYLWYVDILDLWPDFKPSTTSASIIARQVQNTISTWKKMDIEGKAHAALLLHGHGYKSLARQILTSVAQYAVSDTRQGMYWPSVGDMAGGTMWQLQIASQALDAYVAINPSSRDIDSILQWLIRQKETRQWGTSATTAQVVNSILTAAKKWAIPSADFTIALNGAQLDTHEADRFLGHLSMDLSAMHPSQATLSIHKLGSAPAWGALFAQYTAPITEVKPQACTDLSIEKTILRQEGDHWVPTTTLLVGDRARVMLIVRANTDLQYVAITDDRAACLEPVEQLPAPIYSQGVSFYRENRDSSTNLFIGNLPKGTYVLTYDMWVNNPGTYASGLATAQSQYAPQIEAHSGGCHLTADK